jgi:hypothetical protein
VLLAVSVSEEVPVMVDGLKVTPLGNPEADRAMLPAKPPVGVMVTVLVPVEPGATVALLAARLKSGVVVEPEPVNVYCAWYTPLPEVVPPGLPTASAVR